jgi:hypothetical protein
MLFRGLDWSDIQDLFRFGVRDTFGRQDEYPEDNKDDTDDRHCSHTSTDRTQVTKALLDYADHGCS